jgi:hypothetical protein
MRTIFDCMLSLIDQGESDHRASLGPPSLFEGCYTCSEEELKRLPEFKDLHPLVQDLLLQNSRDKQWFLEKVPFIRGRNLHLAKCDNCDMCPSDGIRFKSVK